MNRAAAMAAVNRLPHSPRALFRLAEAEMAEPAFNSQLSASAQTHAKLAIQNSPWDYRPWKLLAALQEMLHNIPEGYGGISVEDLNTLLVENPDVTLIDVRTTAELEENGVIEAANWIHIPLEEFINQKDQWPVELDAPIVVYCGSGHRSTIAMTILWAYGYTDVLSMRGGVAEWVKAGYPVIDYVPQP